MISYILWKMFYSVRRRNKMPKVITVGKDTYTIFEIEDIFKIIQDKLGDDVLKELNEYIQELQYTIDDLQSEIVYCSGLIEDLYNDLNDSEDELSTYSNVIKSVKSVLEDYRLP